MFAWNVDKGYLTDLGDVLAVPTLLVTEVAEAIAAFGTRVLTPRVGLPANAEPFADVVVAALELGLLLAEEECWKTTPVAGRSDVVSPHDGAPAGCRLSQESL